MKKTELTELPEWTNALPNHSTMNVRNLAEALGCTQRAVHSRVAAGHIPPFDYQSKSGYNAKFSGGKRDQWSLGTLRRFIASRATEKMEVSSV